MICLRRGTHRNGMAIKYPKRYHFAFTCWARLGICFNAYGKTPHNLLSVSENEALSPEQWEDRTYFTDAINHCVHGPLGWGGGRSCCSGVSVWGIRQPGWCGGGGDGDDNDLRRRDA